jgi:NHLM bacteriocin system ABC transporter ATP-binding protein
MHMAMWRQAGARVRERDAARMARLDARRVADAAAESQALTAIGTLFARGSHAPTGSTGSALHDAMQLVGAAVGVTFERPMSSPPFATLAAHARHIALRASVGCRRVQLEAGWWSRDAGPLLAFTARRQDAPVDERERPVVLLPALRGGYDVVDPVSGARVRADATLAAGLAPYALQFYRALPTTPVRTRAVWQFLAHGLRGDTRSLVVAGLAAALLGVAPPLLTRALFDHVIPAADVAGLTAVLLALLVASASGLLFDLVRAVAVLRLHVRAVHDLQLAVLDRLLRLPVAFFRRFAAGDLGRRVMGIMTIGETVGQATLSTLLGGIAGSAALVLLFWYSVPLALLSVALLALNVALSTIIARRSMPHARARQQATGELSALMLETLRGMAKLRVAAAESRLVARWATPFRQQQQAAFAVARLAVHHTALLAVLDVLSRVALFGSYAWLWAEQRAPLSTGAFVAFAAAEGTFRASVLSIATTLISLLDTRPEWERVGPVLEAVPEVSDARPDPGSLSGHLELRHVHFAYDPNGPDVLEDVSLTIPAGQFVAIVGPSGSGKSTLLRLLLGFEVPRRGSICYDGQDLQLVDRLAVRRQLGVVLQHASLSLGDVYNNVTGNTPRPPDVVWEALRLAGIEDEVRAMPMGLMTLIPDGGSSLSGGQRQRLLIARALIHRPKILLFDEATSALDSRAQRCVSDSVATLHATRVVIAHRLSTVRDADVIVVLDRGRIVETGTYPDLIAQGGVFARLAAQQEA